MRLLASFKEHCVAGYFALEITISWVGVLLVVGQHGVPATPAEAGELGGHAYVPMLVGPVIAGLLFIGLDTAGPGSVTCGHASGSDA